MKLVPYLIFNGNTEEAMKFYSSVLNGEIVMLQRFGESPIPSGPDEKNKIMHGSIHFGNNVLMFSDTLKNNPASTNGNIHLSLDVPEEGKIDEIFSKFAEGGKITMPLQDTFWGARFGMLQDKYGVSWMFNHEKPKG